MGVLLAHEVQFVHRLSVLSLALGNPLKAQTLEDGGGSFVCLGKQTDLEQRGAAASELLTARRGSSFRRKGKVPVGCR